MSAAERRLTKRVSFERPLSAHLMAIDRTWRRECNMYDLSEEGAKLHGKKAARRDRDQFVD
jgi:hypothetical protein